MSSWTEFVRPWIHVARVDTGRPPSSSEKNAYEYKIPRRDKDSRIVLSHSIDHVFFHSACASLVYVGGLFPQQSRAGVFKVGRQIGGRAGNHGGCHAEGCSARTAGDRHGRSLFGRSSQTAGRRRIDKGAFHRGTVRE